MIGRFYGVGVGPGDPELITRKALRVMSEVDWLFLPAAAKAGLGFAHRIVATLGLPKAKFRPISLCMDRGREPSIYDIVADEIALELRQGKSAAWITEGDPLFYSTFMHVYLAMRRRHPDVKIEIVPGVTSLQAAAARTGNPIACLDDMVAVVPAVYGLERLPDLIEEFATVFLIKVNSVFDRLLNLLSSLSLQVEAVYLENIGTPQERVVTDLPVLRGRDIPYFSLVMLRRVK